MAVWLIHTKEEASCAYVVIAATEQAARQKLEDGGYGTYTD